MTARGTMEDSKSIIYELWRKDIRILEKRTLIYMVWNKYIEK